MSSNCTAPSRTASSRIRGSTRLIQRFATPRTFIIGVTIAIIGYLAAVPLCYLVYNTFVGSAGPTLDAFSRAYGGGSQAGTMMVNSLIFAVGSALLSLIIGTALAYVQVRTDAPMKGATFALCLVPLIVPGIQYSVAWIFLADPNAGLINTAVFKPVFGHSFLNVFSLTGMIWVQGIHLAPIAFLMMVGAFRGMDPALEEAALASGATRHVVLRRITLPLLRPAVAAAGLLMFVQSLESFELPALLGLQNRIFVFASRIYYVLHRTPADYGAAGAYAMSLMAVAGVALLITMWLGRGTSRFQTVTGKAFRPRVTQLGRARPLVGVAMGLYFLVTIALPMAILLYASFLPYFHVDSKAFSTLSFANYRALADDPLSWISLKNTVILGIGAATLVTLLTAIASWLVVRTRTPGRKLLDGLAFTPLVIPGIVLGLALSFVYLRTSLPIYGTLWILLIAFVTKYLPYGMRFTGAAMSQVSNELEESAFASGATWWQMFRKVLLPLTSPGLLAGWIFVLIIIFRELSAAILLYSPGNEVLSILMWEQYFDGNFTGVAAIGVVMVAILSALVLIAYRIGNRMGVGTDASAYR